MDNDRVLIVGQLARDLVLGIGEMPDAGGSVDVNERRQMLGGKGANQGVALSQLGVEVRMLGVVGDDTAGSSVLGQARDDGLDIEHVVRRGQTALLLDIVDAHGTRRLFEHVPEEALLTKADVRAAASAFDGVDTVILQLQQPTDALLAAARLAHGRGVRLVLDGAVEGDARAVLLELADVVRVDVEEAELMTGIAPEGREQARQVAARLLDAGPTLVAVAVPDEGNLVAWAEDEVFVPFGNETVVDPTGGGDSFVAGLVDALRRGLSPAQAAQRASDTAASTVTRLGGRPNLREPADPGER